MKIFFFALFVCITLPSVTIAKVQFIADSENDAGASFIPDPNLKKPIKYSDGQRCEASGYSLTKCPQGYTLTGKCPNDSRYYRECCNGEYAFTPEDCTRAGQKTSVLKCGGLHKCI